MSNDYMIQINLQFLNAVTNSIIFQQPPAEDEMRFYQKEKAFVSA